MDIIDEYCDQIFDDKHGTDNCIVGAVFSSCLGYRFICCHKGMKYKSLMGTGFENFMDTMKEYDLVEC